MLRKLSIAAAVLLLASCVAEQIDNQVIPEPVPEVSNSEGCLSGMALIEFDDATADLIYETIGGDSADGSVMTKAFVMTKSSGAEEILEALGATSISRVFPYAGKWEPRHREAGLHRFYRITFDENTPLTKATRSLSGINGVVKVEMKPEVRPAATKVPYNDPYNHLQWNLYNDGSLVRGFRSGIDINVVPVWEKYTAGSKDVVVAVVDGGVNMNHPDMLNVVIPGTEEGGSRSFVYDFEGPETSSDAHGSHVAGIIAAVNNNGVGMTSVAGGSDGTGGVRILSCQNLKEKEDGTTYQGNSAAAVVWGADQGAVISQNSWGYNPEYATGISSDDKAAIDYFIKYAGYDENGSQVGPMAGGVVIFAAGNDNLPKGWPAQYGPIVAVGALGPDGRKATYSNYGDWVDICAPGGEADRFTNNEAMIVSLYKDDGYYYMIGTSQATPHVSGVAALLLSHFGGPGFTNVELVDKLLYGADYTGIFKEDKIGPKLNAYASFDVGKIQDPELVSDYAGELVEGAIPLKSHETLTIRYSVRNLGDMNVTYTFDGGSDAVTGTVSGNDFIVTFNALALEPASYKATLTASFGPGHSTILNIPYNVLKNNAPKASGAISSMIAEDKNAIEIDLSQYFTDEDGEQLTFKADITTQRIVNVSFSGNIMTLKPSSFGSTPITLTATDARGKSAKLSAFTFLYYDISKGVSAYPNPVVDYLKVCAGKEKEMKIVLTNSNGVVLYEETVNGSALSPAQVDMKSFAPGRYGLTVTYDEVTSSKTIVKAL